MTTETIPTAVEALRHAEFALKGAVPGRDEIERATIYADHLRVIVQALQLHGGGGSRSDFASGSVDKVPDATIAVEAIAALAACVGSFALMGGKSPGRRLGHMASSIRAAYVCSSEALEGLQSKLAVHQALSGGGEATPTSETPSNPTLQGPTREEVARVIDPSPWTGTFAGLNVVVADRDAALVKADAILALLKPTSPWRSVTGVRAPRDGSWIVFFSEFGHASDAVAWSATHSRFENHSGQSTTMNDDTAWSFWTPAPPFTRDNFAPIPGGETGT